MVWPNPILTQRALSSNQNCKMCLGRLWGEIKICILNSRLTAPVRLLQASRRAKLKASSVFHEQLEVQFWVVSWKWRRPQELSSELQHWSGHNCHGRMLSLGHPFITRSRFTRPWRALSEPRVLPLHLLREMREAGSTFPSKNILEPIQVPESDAKLVFLS